MDNNMGNIYFENIFNQDLELIREWLSRHYLSRWFGRRKDWIYEIKNKKGEFNYIKHFIIKNENEKIGFCQYYDYYYAQEDWYKTDEHNKIYSIQYIIGNEDYSNKYYGKEIVKILVEKIKEINGFLIIIKPEPERKIINQILKETGFKYNNEKEYYYMKL